MNDMPNNTSSYEVPESDLLHELSRLGTATVHESMGQRGACSHDIAALVPGVRLLGRAFTVAGAAGDNLALHRAIIAAKAGDVIVATVGAYREAGVWGEIMTAAAQSRGIAGLLTDGACRDIAAIRLMKFPIYGAGLSIKGTSKAIAGQLQETVICGGVAISPGDVILGDDDGVVVVPGDAALVTLEAALQRERAESEILAEIGRGVLPMSRYVNDSA